jgi:sodium-dependent dicarboxylate transporter 2/3/5
VSAGPAPAQRPAGAGARRSDTSREIGLVVGVAAFALLVAWPPPAGLGVPAQRAGAVAALMAVWWVTEAIPIYATALLPLVLYPLLGVLDAKQAAAPYAEPTIFLFLGGFFLAMAMVRWGLHRRFALHVIRLHGTSRRHLVFGFMAATAAISMWVSNTATTVMVYPVALAVLARLEPEADAGGGPGRGGFGAALMLGVAYAASIGGVGTLVGTPPNAIFAGQARLLFPHLPPVDFLRYMLVGVPYVLVFLPLAWLTLVTLFLRHEGRGAREANGAGAADFAAELRGLGPLSRAEATVLAVFALAAFGWIFRADLKLGGFTLPGWADALGLGDRVQDATVAVAAALLLFLIPVDRERRHFALDWDWAVRIPWGVLLLFGGGFALAESFHKTGLAAWLAGHMTGLAGLPLLPLLFCLTLGVTVLSEFASNTAVAALLMPILAATATGIGVHPYILMLCASIAASSGFALPVATAANAIVFGSGRITARQMLKAGLVLDLIAAILIPLILYFVAIPVFGL